MITQILMGGMGNQMFQYAFGLAQAARLGVDLGIDATRLSGSRPFNLTQWSLPCLTITTREQPTVKEHGMAYNPYLFDVIKDGDVIQGYFQSEKYFANLPPDKLRKIFLPSFPLSERAEKLRAQITGLADSCFIHIRRGDYLKEPHKSHHGTLSSKYYADAITQIWKNVGLHPHYFLFSDDIEWVKEEFGCERFHFVESGREAEDIYLMSLCKHAIIANSTFSWWGAWLGDDKPGRTVIAPKRWFDQAPEDPRDIVPERWIKI